MATCSFDKEYILARTPENIELIRKLEEIPDSPTQIDLSSVSSETKEFIQKLLESRGW